MVSSKSNTLNEELIKFGSNSYVIKVFRLTIVYMLSEFKILMITWACRLKFLVELQVQAITYF